MIDHLLPPEIVSHHDLKVVRASPQGACLELIRARLKFLLLLLDAGHVEFGLAARIGNAADDGHGRKRLAWPKRPIGAPMHAQEIHRTGQVIRTGEPITQLKGGALSDEILVPGGLPSAVVEAIRGVVELAGAFQHAPEKAGAGIVAEAGEPIPVKVAVHGHVVVREEAERLRVNVRCPGGPPLERLRRQQAGGNGQPITLAGPVEHHLDSQLPCAHQPFGGGWGKRDAPRRPGGGVQEEVSILGGRKQRGGVHRFSVDLDRGNGFFSKNGESNQSKRQGQGQGAHRH